MSSRTVDRRKAQERDRQGKRLAVARGATPTEPIRRNGAWAGATPNPRGGAAVTTGERGDGSGRIILAEPVRRGGAMPPMIS